jgi:CBS domain-containing protein
MKKQNSRRGETMSEIGLRSKMLVKDVMSSPVITIEENTAVNKAAELMDKYDYGCIIVTNKAGKPLGIITERDLVVRVLAKNVKPDSFKAKEVMTSPLMTIEPDAAISDAARKMSKLNIRRFGVVYRGQLIGLVSSKDILAVMPELVEIIQEQAKIGRESASQESQETEEQEEEEAPLAGYCDRCGAWSDTLTQINGEFLCEDCKEEAEEAME